MTRSPTSSRENIRADLFVCLAFAALGFMAGGVEFWLTQARTFELASSSF